MAWASLGFKLQVLAVIVATLYLQFKENPALAKRDIGIVEDIPVVEEHLSKYKSVIGADYDGYRNHIYRVLTYATHFLNDESPNMDVIGTALVYHDIGLWTAKTLAYLEPSAELARKECAHKYTPEQLDLQESIIVNHHKLWPVRNAREVEAVRKADWIDASNGFFNKGMPRAHIRQVKDAIPAAGFYKTLADVGPRYHGNNVWKILSEILTIFKW
jgi:hypothetical protein